MCFMMDHFREEIVTRKQGRVINSLGYILSWLFVLLFGIVALIGLLDLMNMNFALVNWIFFVIGGGLCFLMFRYKDNFRIEYEYAFTNGEMEFAMVKSNTRRKELMSIRMREVEAGGYVDGAAYVNATRDSDFKEYRYYLNGSSKLYFLTLTREGKRIMIIFEPSEEMVELMQGYSRVLEI